MPLSHIEHILVAADDIDATRDWYARVLGMKSGPHPDFGFPVHWMYLGERDVVHIGPSAKMAGDIQKQYLGRTSQGGGQGTGAILCRPDRGSLVRVTQPTVRRSEWLRRTLACAAVSSRNAERAAATAWLPAL